MDYGKKNHHSTQKKKKKVKNHKIDVRGYNPELQKMN
jgi:hypothetical protein